MNKNILSYFFNAFYILLDTQYLVILNPLSVEQGPCTAVASLKRDTTNIRLLEEVGDQLNGPAEDK